MKVRRYEGEVRCLKGGEQTRRTMMVVEIGRKGVRGKCQIRVCDVTTSSSSSSSSILGLANMPPVAENATITAENVQNSPILSQVDLNAFNRNN